MSDPDAMPRDWWEQEQEAMLDDWIRRYAEERFVADGDEEAAGSPANQQGQNTTPNLQPTTGTNPPPRRAA